MYFGFLDKSAVDQVCNVTDCVCVCVCVYTEGCNSSLIPSADVSQQRLYSPSNHISPGKAASCLSKRLSSTGSATTPPSGVLKNVMVSHHMDRSSSTPRLTLKFHHVKRHENGIAAAADGSRIHSVADGNHLPAAISAGSKTASSISCLDSQYVTASSSGIRYHGGDVELKNSFEKNQNSTSAERPCSQQSAVTPFSPQFEDISDAEDEVRPAAASSRDSTCTVPAYGLPSSAAQCLPPLSAGFYPSANSSTFCTSAAVSVLSPFPPFGWNSCSGYASQTAMTLPVSSLQSYGVMLPWASENHTQRGVINRLSPSIRSSGGSGAVSPADFRQLNLSSKQPFFSNRLVGSDSARFPKSELLPVKSEISVSQTETSSSHQTSIKSERYNGHVGDDPCVKAELPTGQAESGQKLVPSPLESKPNVFSSQPKSEETALSNSDRDTFAGSRHTREAKEDNSVKAGSFDSEPSLHNSVHIKREVGSVRCV